MRIIARMGLVGSLFLVAASVIAREPFQLERSRPESTQELQDVLRGDDPETSIPAYLDDAQCGGWDKNTGVEPYIATVQGLPGRPHDWDGDVRSGMATRTDTNGNNNPNDDFVFPDSARGFATSCSEKKDRITKKVWRPVAGVPNQVRQFDVEFAHPYFEDPPCRWRYANNAQPPRPLPDNPGNIPPSNQDAFETEDADSCASFCSYLNSFLYRDCVVVRQDGDAMICDEWGERYICTDGVVNEENRNAACFVPHPDLEEWANARPCVGEQCRCPNTQDPQTCMKVQNQEKKDVLYTSYERTYPEASYRRDALANMAPQDVAAKNFQVACYGLYNEFDPKVRQTTDDDRRCVMNIDIQGMRDTQMGKGTYQEQNVQDRDPTQKSLQRPGGSDNEAGAFDDEKDVWYKKLGTAFSFINEKVFDESYDRDISNVFLAYDELDEGRQRATAQISDAQLFTEDDLLRAFDDTGNPRAFTRWWQEQQSRIVALTHPPVLRILVPSSWFVGLDPDDPFLRTVERPDTADVARNDRIELQIDADDDSVGDALAYLERSVLLKIEEESIPIEVPIGSPLDFRARAADWCNWYKSENIADTCDNAPQPIKDMMKRLEEYAQRIDDYRALRAEIAYAAGDVLDLQYRLMEPITTWFKKNEQALQNLGAARNDAQKNLLPLWQEAQNAITQLHERSNMPWCMNQRYTAPVYSLLDPWLIARGQGANEELGLPVLPTPPSTADIIVDFSAQTTMSGTIKIPVLKPIFREIHIPAPPVTTELAELPPLDDVHIALQEALDKLPTVENRLEPPALVPPQPLDQATMGKARETLGNMLKIALAMNQRYNNFWLSIGPLEEDENGEALEQFHRQIELKTQMKCFDLGRLPCEHAEMDLLEQAQRIGSRPLVQLKEDYDSIGTERSDPTSCLPEDENCRLLHPERTDPGVQWEVHGVGSPSESFNTLRTTILTLTQPPPLGDVDPTILSPHEAELAPLQSFPSIRLLP